MKKSIWFTFLLLGSLTPSYEVSGGPDSSFEEEVHELAHRCSICFECYEQETLLTLSCGHKACSRCYPGWLEENDENKCIFCAKRTREEDDLAVLQSTENIVSQWKKVVFSTTLGIGLLFVLYASFRRWRG